MKLTETAQKKAVLGGKKLGVGRLADRLSIYPSIYQYRECGTSLLHQQIKSKI